MENQQSAIRKLEEFKKLIANWEIGNTRSSSRGEISKRLQTVRNLVLQAGTLKTFTIAPPPAIGGLIMKNVDPFSCIFEPPYRQSVIPMLVDSIDEAIGVIETNDIFATLDIDNKEKPPTTKSNRVFIVHGRNDELKETTARYLERLDLVPVILHEQTNKGKTIIEKFEEYADVSFAVVLMTPDDLGSLSFKARHTDG